MRRVLESVGQSTPSRRVRQQAEDWFVRLQSPDCSEADRTAFDHWRRAHLAHAEAYAATERLWGRLAVLKDAPEARPYLEKALIPAPRRPPARGHRPAWARAAIFAAGAAALAGIVASGLWWASLRWSVEPQIYAASATEPRTVTLQDGTAVELDVSTRIAVRLNRRLRAVELAAGRALFDVTHDPRRPFTVAADDTRITALGTQFQVQRDGEKRLTVTVLEGAVAVRPAATPPAGAREVRLSPGEQLMLASPVGDWEVRSVDVAVVTSWTHGRLIFRGTPLAEAVAEINRYAQRKIRLADPSLADLPLSGTFRTGDADSIATALPAVLPVRVVDTTADEILLDRRF